MIKYVLCGVFSRSHSWPRHCGNGTGIPVSWSPGGDFPTVPWGHHAGCLPPTGPVIPEQMLAIHSTGRVFTQISQQESVFITLLWLTQRSILNNKVAFYSLSLLDFKRFWPNAARSFSSMDPPLYLSSWPWWDWHDLIQTLRDLGPNTHPTIFKSLTLSDI